MNKEALRKELEDCWDAGHSNQSPPRDTYITTRLAALGDGDVKDGKWKLVGHSGQIADTGDYDGCYELTDGKISIFTKDDDEEGLQEIINVLNQYDRNFFMDDSQHWEIESLKLQLQELKEPKPLADGEGEKDMVEAAKVIYGNIIEYGRQAMPPDWKEYSKTPEGKTFIRSIATQPLLPSAVTGGVKEHAIGFDEWKRENDYHESLHRPDRWYIPSRETDVFVYFTNEQLYQKFLDEGNAQKE